MQAWKFAISALLKASMSPDFSDKSQADQLLLQSLLQWRSFYCWENRGVWTPMSSP